MHKNIAIILAGGCGSRFTSARPKQLHVVAGRSILAHSVAAFRACSLIDEVAIVAHKDWQREMAESLSAANLSADTWLFGGTERHESSLAAIHHFVEREAHEGGAIRYRLLLHDAARCLVSPTTIAEICTALDHADAVNLLTPVTDTIVELSEGGEAPFRPLLRPRLRSVQTPQGFRLHTLAQAYRRALDDPNFYATDDCSVVAQYQPQARMAIVEGTPENFKITFPHDLHLAAFVLETKAQSE